MVAVPTKNKLALFEMSFEVGCDLLAFGSGRLSFSVLDEGRSRVGAFLFEGSIVRLAFVAITTNLVDGGEVVLSCNVPRTEPELVL